MVGGHGPSARVAAPDDLWRFARTRRLPPPDSDRPGHGGGNRPARGRLCSGGGQHLRRCRGGPDQRRHHARQSSYRRVQHAWPGQLRPGTADERDLAGPAGGRNVRGRVCRRRRRLYRPLRPLQHGLIGGRLDRGPRCSSFVRRRPPSHPARGLRSSGRPPRRRGRWSGGGRRRALDPRRRAREVRRGAGSAFGARWPGLGRDSAVELPGRLLAGSPRKLVRRRGPGPPGRGPPLRGRWAAPPRGLPWHRSRVAVPPRAGRYRRVLVPGPAALGLDRFRVERRRAP